MKIVTKPVSELTPEEYGWCRSANMRQNGCMQDTLRDYRRAGGAIAIMAIDESKTGHARLLGWALLFNGNNVYFYTKKIHRRKGIGTVLMKEVKTHRPLPVVDPWRADNGAFFSNFKVRTRYKYQRKSYLDNRKRIC